MNKYVGFLYPTYMAVFGKKVRTLFLQMGVYPLPEIVGHNGTHPSHQPAAGDNRKKPGCYTSDNTQSRNS